MLFSESKNAPTTAFLFVCLFFHQQKMGCICIFKFCHWKIAFNLQNELFDPTDHCWLNDSRSIGTHWKGCKSTLKAILEFATCSWSKLKCGTNQCICVSFNPPYADLCLCISCKKSSSDTNTDTEDMFDDNVYESWQL